MLANAVSDAHKHAVKVAGRHGKQLINKEALVAPGVRVPLNARSKHRVSALHRCGARIAAIARQWIAVSTTSSANHCRINAKRLNILGVTWGLEIGTLIAELLVIRRMRPPHL
jgi:hypothetical protein